MSTVQGLGSGGDKDNDSRTKWGVFPSLYLLQAGKEELPFCHTVAAFPSLAELSPHSTQLALELSHP